MLEPDPEVIDYGKHLTPALVDTSHVDGNIMQVWKFVFKFKSSSYVNGSLPTRIFILIVPCLCSQRALSTFFFDNLKKRDLGL